MRERAAILTMRSSSIVCIVLFRLLRVVCVLPGFFVLSCVGDREGLLPGPLSTDLVCCLVDAQTGQAVVGAEIKLAFLGSNADSISSRTDAADQVHGL